MSEKANVKQSEEEAIAEARKQYLELSRISDEREAATYEAMLDWVEAKKRYIDARNAALDVVDDLNDATHRYFDLVPNLYEYDPIDEEEPSAVLRRLARISQTPLGGVPSGADEPVFGGV